MGQLGEGTHLLELLGHVRHTNTLVLADRGFPFWPQLETVDISLVDDVRAVTLTVWTNGAHGQWTVAGVSLASNGRTTSYGLTGPGQRYEEMFSDLVSVATGDFRPTYERRRIAD